jgi:hypothetical protein
MQDTPPLFKVEISPSAAMNSRNSLPDGSSFGNTSTPAVVISGVFGGLILLAVVCAVDWIITHRLKLQRNPEDFGGEKCQNNHTAYQRHKSRIGKTKTTDPSNVHSHPLPHQPTAQHSYPINSRQFQHSVRFPNLGIPPNGQLDCENNCRHPKNERSRNQKSNTTTSTTSACSSITSNDISNSEGKISVNSDTSTDDVSRSEYLSLDSGYSSCVKPQAKRGKRNLDKTRFIEKLCQQMSNHAAQNNLRRPPAAYNSRYQSAANTKLRYPEYSPQQYTQRPQVTFMGQTSQNPSQRNGAQRRRRLIEQERERRKAWAIQPAPISERKSHPRREYIGKQHLQHKKFDAVGQSLQAYKGRRDRYAPVVDETWVLPFQKSGTLWLLGWFPRSEPELMINEEDL